MAWLEKQPDPEMAVLFLACVSDFAPYMKTRSLNHQLLHYCGVGLALSEKSGREKGWLLLLQQEAHFALGMWNEALSDTQMALKVTYQKEPIYYARAKLLEGRVQFNRGNYTNALETLSVAESLLRDQEDWENVVVVRREMAAYYLNRGNYKEALKRYLEIQQPTQGLKDLDDHTLLMLGVVYRRLGDYDRATQHLEMLLHRNETRRNRAGMATALHHLAWLYLNQDDFQKASEASRTAFYMYVEINDIRGSSDTDEQLGIIALAEGNEEKAQRLLLRSLETRQRIGNQQGIANSLRRLALLHMRRRQLCTAIRYLFASLVIYRRLGILDGARVRRLLRELFSGRGIM